MHQRLLASFLLLPFAPFQLYAQETVKTIRQFVAAACDPLSADAVLSPPAYKFRCVTYQDLIEGFIVTQGGTTYFEAATRGVAKVNRRDEEPEPMPKYPQNYVKYLRTPTDMLQYDERNASVLVGKVKDMDFMHAKQYSVPFGWMRKNSLTLTRITSAERSEECDYRVEQRGDMQVFVRSYKEKQFNSSEIFFDADLLPISYRSVDPHTGELGKARGEFQWQVEGDSVLLRRAKHWSDFGDLEIDFEAWPAPDFKPLAMDKTKFLASLPKGTRYSRWLPGRGTIDSTYLPKNGLQSILKKDNQMLRAVQKAKYSMLKAKSND